ncbi:MAG: hypothetical protein ACREEM_07910, partial [Blastocatellia bacterium]
MFCSKCGQQISDLSKYCPTCGVVTSSATQATVTPLSGTDNFEEKPKWGAAKKIRVGILLTLLIGAIGLWALAKLYPSKSKVYGDGTAATGGLFELPSSNKKALDRSAATQIIESSKLFRDSYTINVSFGYYALANCDYIESGGDPGTPNHWLVFRDLGLIELRNKTGQMTPLSAQTVGCEALLTESGSREAQQWKRRSSGGGNTSYSVDIAAKQFIEVTGISGGDGDSAVAECTWKWSLNQIGERLLSQNKLHMFADNRLDNNLHRASLN